MDIRDDKRLMHPCVAGRAGMGMNQEYNRLIAAVGLESIFKEKEIRHDERQTGTD